MAGRRLKGKFNSHHVWTTSTSPSLSSLWGGGRNETWRKNRDKNLEKESERVLTTLTTASNREMIFKGFKILKLFFKFTLNVFSLKNGPTKLQFRGEYRLFKWAIPGLLLVYFRLFQTNITIFTTNNCEKCPSSKWCWDSNPQPFEHVSSPITTGPGLQRSPWMLNRKYN